MIRLRFFLPLTMYAVVLLHPSCTFAQPIPIGPGFDLFATPGPDQGGTTEVRLNLPFGPGTSVPLMGVPIRNLFGDELYDTDTIVQRHEGLPNGNGTIPIELVALSLQSVEPVDIQGMLFDVHVIGGSLLDPNNPSPPGEMQIEQQDAIGGFFNSQLPVHATVRLTEVENPSNVIQMPFQDVFEGQGPWLDIPGPQYPHATAFPSGGFYPSVGFDDTTRQTFKIMTEEQALLARHGVVPAMKMHKWAQFPVHGKGENIPSDVDWRTVMNSPDVAAPPNWVIADDFRSDGRPITTIHWWGSYFDEQDQPQKDLALGEYFSMVEDGFVVSFFKDQPANPDSPDSFSQPANLMGNYVIPIDAVDIRRTEMVGWDGHPVWEYQADLRDGHLDHPSELSDPDAFLERAGEIYWISILAETGHKIGNVDGQWVFDDSGKPIRDDHYWGWHTSPDTWNDVPTMGHLLMPDDRWNFGQWRPIDPQHGEFDMAFKLITPEGPQRPMLMADFDKDNDVDEDDLKIWQTNFGTTSGATMMTGDADMDGDVDGKDFLKWQREHGMTVPPITAVPEPTSLYVFVCAAVGLFASRSRRYGMNPL